MLFWENLLLMIVLMAVGFIAGKAGVLQKDDTKVISNIIYYISAPALVFYNLATTFQKDQLVEGAIIPFAAAALTVLFSLVAKLGAKRSGIPVEKASLFVAVSTFSNTIFLGLPVIVALYGPQSTFYVVLYDLGATLVFWVLGMALLSGGADMKLRDIVKATLNFPLLCFIVGLAVVLLSIPVPGFIMRVTKDLGGITTPLAMVFIGLTLAGASLTSYRTDKTLKYISLLKLVVMPFIALLCLWLLPLSPLPKKVMIMEAAMPVMVTIAILSKKFDRDYEYTTRAVIITTLLFFITVPLFGVLLNQIF